MPRMNTIGIENNLDRCRIRKLLATGLLGCVLTGVGDLASEERFEEFRARLVVCP